MSFRYRQSSFWKLKFSEAVAQKNELIPALGKSCSALQVPVSSSASCHHLGDKTVSVRWSVTSCLSNFFCWKPCEGTRRPPSLAGCDAVLLKDDFSPAGQDQAVGAQIILCVCKCIHVWWDSTVPKAVWWLNCARRPVLLWNICCLLYTRLPGFL